MNIIRIKNDEIDIEIQLDERNSFDKDKRIKEMVVEIIEVLNTIEEE